MLSLFDSICPMAEEQGSFARGTNFSRKQREKTQWRVTLADAPFSMP